MTLYIELVIIDNFVMTFAIGVMSYMYAGLVCKKCRLIICSAVGTIASVFYPFIPIYGVFLVAMKVAIGVLLGIILFAGLCNAIKGCVIFFIITAMAGGLCVMINYMLVGDLEMSLVTAPIMPYSACTAIILVCMFVIKRTYAKVKRRQLRYIGKHKVCISFFGEKYHLNAFMDTGNTLYDDITGYPIIVVKLSALKPLSDDVLMPILLKNYNQIVGMREIETSGLGGDKKIPIIKADEIKLYLHGKLNIHSNVMVGIAIKNFGGDADVLLHPALIQGE